MDEVFKKRIIKLLKHPDYKPLSVRSLAGELGVSAKDKPDFEQAVDQLCRSGKIVVAPGRLIRPAPMAGQIIGTFRANQKGFGFVTPLEISCHDDVFIPARKTSEAMTGDIVAVRITKRSRRSGKMGYSGEVIDILERAENKFVGTLLKQPDGWVVQPDSRAFTDPITIDEPGAKNAKKNDKVVVEVLSYPTARYLGSGVIIEVLGRKGRYESEIKSIIHRYHLPTDFSKQALEQAGKTAADFDAALLDGRDDITAKTVITIDPEDAKDFDDAISLEKTADGNWKLGVHIADVSYFIPAGSPLDTEGRLRGNSVYLPGKTIPMLPEVLSNGICSLQPERKRCVKSVYLVYNAQADVISRSFANSVICSTQRLTYKQAERILKGRSGAAKPAVRQMLKNMEKLSRKIQQRRTKQGMLSLDLPETELVMDNRGKVVDTLPADDSYPHTMIEMFMVEANEAVAIVIDRLNIAFMRRIHPEPDSLTMKNLAGFIRSLKLAGPFNMPRNPSRKDIQNILNAVKGKPYSLAVNLMVLRSFEKARYSPLNIGHFALASRHYCHFTSPIRRYSDLLVHRILEEYLKQPTGGARKLQTGDEPELTEIGRHITFTEQRAEDAERELKTVLILQMLSEHIGTEAEGLVTGLAGFGVFVRLRKFGVEGLIAIEQLGQGRWKYDAAGQYITASRGNYRICLGQPLKVKIISVNIGARQLNLCPAEPLISTSRPAKRLRKKRKR